MGQKQGSKTTQWAIVALIVAIVALATVSFNLSGTTTKTTSTTTNAITQSIADDFCSNNPAVDAKVRLQDTLAVTKTYVNGTLLVQNLDTNSIQEVSVTSGGTTGFTTVSQLFDCKSKNGYKVFIMGGSTDNSDSSLVVTTAMLKQNPVEFTLATTVFSQAKMKAYDNVDKAKVMADSGSLDYVTGSAIQFNGTSGAGFSNIASDVLDVDFTLAPNTANQAFGNGLYVALDTEDQTNIADWDETSVEVFFNGVKLTEASGLAENELRALNGYEKIYKLDGTVGKDAKSLKEAQSALRVRMTSESSETTRDFKPIVKLVALGDYQSNKADAVLTGIGFQDNTGRTPIYTPQVVTLLIAP
jgi:hypothetical protein